MLQPVRAPAFSPDLPGPGEEDQPGRGGRELDGPAPVRPPGGCLVSYRGPPSARSTAARTAVGVDTIGETEEATATATAAESTPSANAAAAVFCVKELQLPRARSPSEGVSGVEREWKLHKHNRE